MTPRRKALALILLVLAYLHLRGIGDHGLLDPLEGINASVSLGMAAGQGLLAPSIEGLPYLGKSLGFWWLEALSLKVFGWNEFSVRIVSALGALGLFMATWFIARRLKNESAANYATVIAGTSFLTFVASQLASPHTLYAFCLALTLAGLVHGLRDIRCILLFHAGASAAFLVHGPAGILLPWFIFLLYAWIVEQEDYFLKALLYKPGILITLLTAGGYLLLLYFQNSTVLTMMRYNPPAPAFASPASSLLLLFVGLCPWGGVLFEASKEALPGSWFFIPPSKRDGFLLLLWAAVFAFFGVLSGDGLQLVVIVPALASLCGLKLSQTTEAKDTRGAQKIVAVTLLFFMALLFIALPWFYVQNGKMLSDTWLSVVPWMFFCGLFLFSGIYYARTRQPHKLALHLCTTSLLALLPLAGVYDLLAERVSIKNVGIYLRDEATPQDVLFQYAMNRPSLFFYTAQNPIPVDTEPLFGLLGQRPIGEPDLHRLWRGPRRAFLILDRHQMLSAPLPGEVFNLEEVSGLTVLSNKRGFPRLGE